MMTAEQVACTQLDGSRQGYEAWQFLEDDPESVYAVWNQMLPPLEDLSDLDVSKLIFVFIGANSSGELDDRGGHCYYSVLDTLCQATGVDMAKIIFYTSWTAMRDGEVSRERDPDAKYLIFFDGHGKIWTPSKEDEDPSYESEISEGFEETDFRPTTERLAYLKELDREILLIVIPICWSYEAARVLLSDDVVKHVYPQDDFTIHDDYAVEFKHRMSSLELYFEKAWPPNDKRIEDRLSVTTDCGTK